MPTVFYLGATGYIGSSVLVTLRAAFPTYSFKALVRNTSAVETLNSQPPRDVSYKDNVSLSNLPKVEAIKGSFEDLELIAKLASEVDVVVNTAESDNLELLHALLKGIKQRFDAGLGPAAFIHTSGTAIFWDDAKGAYDPQERVWSDSEDDIRDFRPSIPKRIHGPADLLVLEAQEEGYVNAVVILPSIVHGVGRSPLPGRASVFFQLSVRDILQRRDVGGVPRKGVGYIGEGTARVGAVHVNDLADLYALVLKELTSSESSSTFNSSPHTRYIIASSENDVPYKDIVVALGAALQSLGELDDPAPKSYSQEEIQEVPILAMLASRNTLVKPERAFKLGWKPNRQRLVKSIKQNVVDFLEAEKAK